MTIGSLVQLSGVVVDLIYRIDHRPEPGGEAEANEVLITAGGGFNAMVAASHFLIPAQPSGYALRGLGDVRRRQNQPEAARDFSKRC